MKNICPDIVFVGVEDDNLDLFEAQFPLPQGISYNSYLIEDEKIAIMDAVDERRTDDWLDRVDAALNGRKPDFIVVHHVEPDHTGSIEALLRKFPDLKIVCTQKAVDILHEFFEDLPLADITRVVKDGDTLSLGRTELLFLTAPMVHWPEVMVTVDRTHEVLFSADAFGSFSMYSAEDAWPISARRYYTNIIGKYGPSVQGLMKKLKPLPVKIVAPLHGPVLTENLGQIWDLYDKWSRYEPESGGVLIAYASGYGGTAAAARRLGAMLEDLGAEEVVIMDLCRHDVSYAVAEAFRLKRIMLCSVTYDASVFPAMHAFIHHLQMKNLRNRIVGLIENGSWAPIAGKVMTDMLAQMKDITIIEPAVKLRSRLHTADLQALSDLAKNILA